MVSRAGVLGLAVSTLPVLALGVARPARAEATLCVDAGGAGGCAASVQAAVDAVSEPHTTITVAPGVYTASCAEAACSVAAIRAAAPNASALVGLTLQCGRGNGHSVHLDATHLDHAVYVSGVDQVTIEGCVAENADREGILVEGSRNVAVIRNVVQNNDQAMARTAGSGNPPCPTFLAPGTPGTGAIQCCPDAFSGGPGGFPLDNDDCGEGIHLRSVTSSVVRGNFVHDNIGGILLTDETGPNQDNLVVGNIAEDNTKFGGDCGVTLASHVACAPGSNDASGCTPAPPVDGILQGSGVFHNAVVGNVLRRNGASGAGMFANPGAPPGAATKAFGNLVSGNVVADNGQPGIAIHVHAANGNADHNVITDNVVRGNGADEEVGGSPPPRIGIEILSNGAFPGFSPAAPVVGTIVSRNTVSGEDVDVWVGNTQTDAGVFLNALLGDGAVGVQNAGSGTVTATQNWWGCPAGPGSPGCSSTTGSVLTSPSLGHSIHPGGNP